MVEAFLYLMSRRDTYESLTKFEGLIGALRSTVLRLGEALSGSSAATPASIDVGLVEAMVAGLDGVTMSAWPDRVFELGCSVEEGGDARSNATLS